MQIDKAANVEGIFFALMRLSEDNTPHTVSNILDFLKSPNLDYKTVLNTLNYLVDCGAIVDSRGRSKGGRRGSRSPRFVLYPENIPPEVWTTKSSKATHSRWLQQAVKKELAIKGGHGVYYFNLGYLIKTAEEPLVNMANDIAQQLGHERNIDVDWLRKNLDRRIELDEDSTFIFHICICWHEGLRYCDYALSQSGTTEQQIKGLILIQALKSFTEFCLGARYGFHAMRK